MIEMDNLSLVDATELIKSAPSEEEIYSSKINAFHDNLMSSCVANNARRIFKYQTTVVLNGFGSEKTTECILQDTKSVFEKLNYKVTIEKIIGDETKSPSEPFNLLTIDWSISEDSSY